MDIQLRLVTQPAENQEYIYISKFIFIGETKIPQWDIPVTNLK